MRRLIPFTLLATLFLSGCRVPAQVNLTLPEVQTILTDAQWGVVTGCTAEWLTAPECTQINNALVEAEYAVQQASQGTSPAAIAKGVLQRVEATLAVDSHLRPYFDAAIVLL